MYMLLSACEWTLLTQDQRDFYQDSADVYNRQSARSPGLTYDELMGLLLSYERWKGEPLECVPQPTSSSLITTA